MIEGRITTYSALRQDRPTHPRRQQHVLDVFHLVRRRAPDLADGFRHEIHAVDVGLADQAAIRRERDRAVESDVAVLDEGRGLAGLAEAHRLEVPEDGDREMVVEHADLDVSVRQARPSVELLRTLHAAVEDGQILVVEVRDGLGLEGHRLGRVGDAGGLLAQVAGALFGRLITDCTAIHVCVKNYCKIVVLFI